MIPTTQRSQLPAEKMSNSAQSLSLERKIKMHEAREGIINRLAMTLPGAINLDRFLNVIVSELGRMMNVDRCDVIQLTSASELRISHEWRASNDVPSSLGTVIPARLETTFRARRYQETIRLDDVAASGLDQKVRFLAASLGTRSLLGRAGCAERRRSRLSWPPHDTHTSRMVRRRGLHFYNPSPDRSRWLPVPLAFTPTKSAKLQNQARAPVHRECPKRTL
jgi:hypothetical protein